MPLPSTVAAVFTAAVLAAGVARAVRVVVMIAARLGIIAERAVEQRLHRRIRYLSRLVCAAASALHDADALHAVSALHAADVLCAPASSHRRRRGRVFARYR